MVISSIVAANGYNLSQTSIDFIPPNPQVVIDNPIGATSIDIILSLGTGANVKTRTVSINTSGLIQVK